MAKSLKVLWRCRFGR